jgi:hypothetical protein
VRGERESRRIFSSSSNLLLLLRLWQATNREIPQGLKMYKFALLPVEKREESLRASSQVFFWGITNGRE